MCKAQGLTKTKVKVVGADAIYATNKNCVFVIGQNIQTDFKPKGKPSNIINNKDNLKQSLPKKALRDWKEVLEKKKSITI